MPNYLTPPDAQQRQQIQQQINNRTAAGIQGRKILGDCGGLRDGIEAGEFRLTENTRRPEGDRNGTGPVALHTEFAMGTAKYAGDKPYAMNSDTVFYLQRADKKSGDMARAIGATGNILSGMTDRPTYKNNFSNGSPSNLPAQAGAQAPQAAEFGAATQTGPSTANVESQTPMNQIASKQQVAKLDNPVSTAAPAGALTGLDIDQVAPVGAQTQFGAATMGPVASAANLTQYKYSLKERIESIPASQFLFSEILQKSFNPSFDPASPDRILGSISRGSISSLAQRLALASNGVTNSRDLIEAINNGRIGLTSPLAGLQASRLGPTSLLQTTTTAPRRPYSGATTYGGA